MTEAEIEPTARRKRWAFRVDSWQDWAMDRKWLPDWTWAYLPEVSCFVLGHVPIRTLSGMSCAYCGSAAATEGRRP